jgi:hypothetical protein
MVKVILVGPRTQEGKVPRATVEMDVVPRVGEDIEHEPSGIKGMVVEIVHWWNVKGVITVEVRVK